VARKSDTRSVPRGESRTSLLKAEEFAASAASELRESRWNAAGLAAIHCGIAAADAVLIASAGIRSISQDHGSVVRLLENQVPEFHAAQRRQLGGLLKVKNAVAYEQRLLTATESRQLVDHANRLTSWARLAVGAQGTSQDQG